MSIYVQIATIEDNSITSTVESAYENAAYPEDLYIGIAATVSDAFFKEKIMPLIKYPNVSIKRFDPNIHRGLGKGRVNSRFAYDDQDYILQVDAHTLFEKNWDRFILKVLDKAIEETGNPKTLVTAYLGRYGNRGGKDTVLDNSTGYSLWPEKNVTNKVPLKGVKVTKIEDFPDDALSDKSRVFYPSNRVAGNFIFGNREWANYHGWSGEETFWEEEILPAISLLNNGFSLVFPNFPMPLTHKYYDEDPERQLMDEIFDRVDDINDLAISYIKKFVSENWEACEKYRDYAGYDLATNTVTYKVYVPDKYGF